MSLLRWMAFHHLCHHYKSISSVILFPACKINLGLNIVRKRADGFHDLQTVFYPVAIHDALEVIRHTPLAAGVAFSSTGLHMAGSLEDNLCVKAYRMLKEDFLNLPPVKMHLHKAIPMGAGLGGGSADGAFALKLLNAKFHLQLSDEALLSYALRLGSDCPFFIKSKPSFATGRGEVLEPVAVDLSGYTIVVVHPGIHVNTGWAFTAITPSGYNTDLKSVVALPVAEWKAALTNDFEEPVCKRHPEIGAIKSVLYGSGALYASLSGSGSAVYGIFESEAPPALSFPAHYFVKSLPAAAL